LVLAVQEQQEAVQLLQLAEIHRLVWLQLLQLAVVLAVQQQIQTVHLEDLVVAEL
jgi:hypothetical protein